MTLTDEMRAEMRKAAEGLLNALKTVDIVREQKTFLTVWRVTRSLDLLDERDRLERERDEAQKRGAAYERFYVEACSQREELQKRAIAAEAAFAAERERTRVLEEALQEAAEGFVRIHDSLLSNGPKQASGEMAAYFRDWSARLLADRSTDADAGGTT